ncbi:MAG: hypothetical protein AVDCRST_MAG40-1151 [uncultured Gemmatimonadaceae bacterium]|uniref:Uncharacterized protein n=1 Tax=uncultured Gemmatimonadaceae bacterium TaxID=246130 RepID=A0A6J4KU75_9BACT|nr:MAG: hypothetical protein AVDCRST_MAG40-1151 [uncultured Gemmatimonadaceae bacterium]
MALIAFARAGALPVPPAAETCAPRREVIVGEDQRGERAAWCAYPPGRVRAAADSRTEQQRTSVHATRSRRGA